MRVHAVTEDGTRYEGESPARMPLRDQVEFERRFGKSIGVLSKFEHLAELKPEEIDPEQLPPTEYVAFIVWRALLRNQEADVPQDFDAFLDLVVEVGFDAGEEEVPDPLGSAQRVDS